MRMKTILIAAVFFASPAAYAQKSCDELKGMEKEACLKKGGTVKANTAGSGSTAAPKPSAAPDGRKDHAKPEDRKRESK